MFKLKGTTLSFKSVRTDKEGAALLGAMQFARQQAVDEVVGEIAGDSDNSDGNTDNTPYQEPVTDPLLSFVIDNDAALKLQSKDSPTDTLLAGYADAVTLQKTYQQISQDTLVVIFYGSNQDPENVDSGISDLVESFQNKGVPVLPLTTGQNPFCNGDERCDDLNSYKETLEINKEQIANYLSNNPINSIVFFGYSWGADMAYDVTKSLSGSHPDLRILGTVYLDGIIYSSLFPLSLVHPANESVLNIYQSRRDWLRGMEVQIDYSQDALDRVIQIDMDERFDRVSHTTIDDDPTVMLIIEEFILDVLKN